MVSIGTANAVAIPRWFNEVALHQSNSDSKLFPYREVDRVSSGTPIPDSGWKLALDLGVDLEYTDRYVIAANSWVDEYGCGDTKESAIADLLTSLLDLRQSLERQQRESVLAEETRDTLAKLTILLVEVGD